MMLTIFTPTYNRGHLLYRVYESLVEQQCNDFEWLVVDDGSTDNTSKIVEQFIHENKIRIRYIYKENGGKHTAHNTAVSNANGKLFLCLDSDDKLAPGAVDAIQAACCELKDMDYGFIAYKQDMTGKLLGTELIGIDDVDYESNQQKICGEFVFIYKKEVIQKYLFPVFLNERFIGESVLNDILELKGYTFRPLRKVIELCEYQSEGLSSNFNALMKNNPAGYCLYFMQRIDLQDTFLKRILYAGKYQCFSIFSGKQKTEYVGKYKRLVAFSKPIGLLFAGYYKLFRGF